MSNVLRIHEDVDRFSIFDGCVGGVYTSVILFSTTTF